MHQDIKPQVGSAYIYYNKCKLWKIYRLKKKTDNKMHMTKKAAELRGKWQNISTAP